MMRTLDCPCGVRIRGDDDDDLVVHVLAHLRDRHPDRDYSRDEILFMAF